LFSWQQPRGGSGDGVAVLVGVNVGVVVGVAVGGTHAPRLSSNPEPGCELHAQSAQKAASPAKSFRQLTSAMSLPHTTWPTCRKLANWQQPRRPGGVTVDVGARVGVGVRRTHTPEPNSNPEPGCEEHTQSAQNVGAPWKSFRQLASVMSLPQIGRAKRLLLLSWQQPLEIVAVPVGGGVAVAVALGVGVCVGVGVLAGIDVRVAVRGGRLSTQRLVSESHVLPLKKTLEDLINLHSDRVMSPQCSANPCATRVENSQQPGSVCAPTGVTSATARHRASDTERSHNRIPCPPSRLVKIYRRANA